LKKPYSIGWLIGALLVLTVGTIVLVLVPVRTCPLCLSMGYRPTKTIHHVVLGMTSKVLLNCPTCEDDGRVTILRSWRSPALAPQVADLLKVQDKSFGSGLDAALESIVAAGGKDPQEVLGREHFVMSSPQGEVRFLPGDQRGRLLVLLRCGPSQTNSVNLVLLERDGVVLDVLSATCVRPLAKFAAEMLPVQFPGGPAAYVSLEAELSEAPLLVWWYDERGRLPAGGIPEPYRESPRGLQYLIGVEGDRLRVIPSAAPPAAP
jgi:hypothetical protein